jgi:uncharacterized protein with ATP-grasp and redox domains
MTIANECVGCIVNQSVKVADAIGADESLKAQLISTVEAMSKEFSFSKTPPEIAADVYEKMAQIAQKDLMKKTGVQNLKFNSALWGLKRIILQMPVKKC